MGEYVPTDQRIRRPLQRGVDALDMWGTFLLWGAVPQERHGSRTAHAVVLRRGSADDTRCARGPGPAAEKRLWQPPLPPTGRVCVSSGTNEERGSPVHRAGNPGCADVRGSLLTSRVTCGNRAKVSSPFRALRGSPSGGGQVTATGHGSRTGDRAVRHQSFSRVSQVGRPRAGGTGVTPVSGAPGER
jgi:hypothetical protein